VRGPPAQQPAHCDCPNRHAIFSQSHPATEKTASLQITLHPAAACTARGCTLRSHSSTSTSTKNRRRHDRKAAPKNRSALQPSRLRGFACDQSPAKHPHSHGIAAIEPGSSPHPGRTGLTPADSRPRLAKPKTENRNLRGFAASRETRPSPVPHPQRIIRDLRTRTQSALADGTRKKTPRVDTAHRCCRLTPPQHAPHEAARCEVIRARARARARKIAGDTTAKLQSKTDPPSNLRGFAASRLRVRPTACRVPMPRQPGGGRKCRHTPHPRPLSRSRGEGCCCAFPQHQKHKFLPSPP